MSLKKIGGWLLARLKEKSTWSGLAVIVATAGAEKAGVKLDQIGQIVGVVTGTALMTMTTSRAAAVDQAE